MRLLGRIEHQLNVLDDAEHLLEAALKLAPDYPAARLDYVRILIDRQKYLQAHGEINELLKVAFKDRFISSLDHPVLRKLRGEV